MHCTAVSTDHLLALLSLKWILIHKNSNSTYLAILKEDFDIYMYTK